MIGHIVWFAIGATLLLGVSCSVVQRAERSIVAEAHMVAK